MSIDYSPQIATLKAHPESDYSGWLDLAIALGRAMFHSTATQFSASAKKDDSGIGQYLPIGAVVDFPANNLPPGWTECDGKAVPKGPSPVYEVIDGVNTLTREAGEFYYLFQSIGTLWGEPTDETFRVPDMRRRQTLGRDTNIVGEITGTETTFLSPTHLPPHGHDLQNMTCDPAGEHGHTTRSLYGRSDRVVEDEGTKSFLGFQSPDFANFNFPNSEDVRVKGSATVEVKKSSVAGDHGHEAKSAVTTEEGLSKSFSIMSPSIVMVKAIRYR